MKNYFETIDEEKKYVWNHFKNWSKISQHYYLREPTLYKFSRTILDWTPIVKNQSLSENMIEFVIKNSIKYNKYLCIYDLIRHQNISIDFMKENKNFIPFFSTNIKSMKQKFFRTLTIHQSLTEKFMNENSDFIAWDKVPFNQKISEDFIEVNFCKLNLEDICNTKILSNNFIYRYYEEINDIRDKIKNKNNILTIVNIDNIIKRKQMNMKKNEFVATKKCMCDSCISKNCITKISSDDPIMNSIMNDKKRSDGRFGLNDDGVATKLLDKNYSPMIIRRYTRLGFPIFVHMICDYNLNDLDVIFHKCIDECEKLGLIENKIQSLRNLTGILSDYINSCYNQKKKGCVESLGVIFYADKMMISSLQGDCMCHGQCRDELYYSLGLMTQM